MRLKRSENKTELLFTNSYITKSKLPIKYVKEMVLHEFPLYLVFCLLNKSGAKSVREVNVCLFVLTKQFVRHVVILFSQPLPALWCLSAGLVTARGWTDVLPV